MRLEYARSGLELRAWCDACGIPYKSAQRHISAKKRDEYLAQDGRASRSAEEFTKRLESLRPKLASTEHAEYLDGLQEILTGLLLDTHQAFLDKIAKRENLRPAELGRLTLATIESLGKVHNDIRGTGTPDMLVEWPLLRGYEPKWYQRDFLLDWPSNLKKRGIEAFIFAFVAGIGTGKTKTGARKFGKLLELNRGIPHGMYAPTYRMLQDATKRTFLEACMETGIPFENIPSQHTIRLWGDTDVLCFSMDNPDHARGPNLGGAWIDEGAQQPTQEAFDVIMGRIRDERANELCLIFTSTPDRNQPFGWAYDVLVKQAIKNKVRMYHGNTRDNDSLADGTYDRLMALYDEKLAMLELGGEFVDVALGRAYYAFDRTRHVMHSLKIRYNPQLPLILMVDFNVNPMHWVVGQSYPHKDGEITYLIDELYLQTTSTEEATREFCDRYGKHATGILLYGDAAGNQRHSNATMTDYAIIESVLEARGVIGLDRHVGKSNPLHSERIKDVNARLRDARGNIHLYISEKCEHVIEDFVRQGVKPGTMQLDKTDPLIGHGSDAVGYYINREHSLRQVQVKTWQRA